MKYIGNKQRLLEFINSVFVTENLPKHGVFIDIFSGTTNVAQFYKKRGYKIISNDFMSYSFVMQFAYIKNNNTNLKFNKILTQDIVSNNSKNRLHSVIDYLNALPGKDGFMSKHYAPNGDYGRQYFSDSNARRIDSIREKIDYWKLNNLISKAEYYVLLSSLINAADFVANISGTYGAYLKIWRSMALKSMCLKSPELISSSINHAIYKEDANKLIRKISGDILYIDPPYNSRQYAPNFHILETLACWDNPKIYGKTGLRSYDKQKSLYSKKSTCCLAFHDLIKNAKTRFILFSYNNEGIIPEDFIIKILKERGKLKIFSYNYRRFRTERDHDKRRYKVPSNIVTEKIYFVKVSQ